MLHGYVYSAVYLQSFHPFMHILPNQWQRATKLGASQTTGSHFVVKCLGGGGIEHLTL